MFERATTIDGSLVEIGRWASSLPDDFPVDAADRDNGITEVTVNGVLLSSGIQLSGTLQLVEGDGTVDVRSYRFDVRNGPILVWRHDCHPGHEHEAGMTGLEHQHIRVGRLEKRIPARRQTLKSLRAKLVGTNLRHAAQK